MKRQLALLLAVLAAFPEIPACLHQGLHKHCSLSQPGASQGSHPCHQGREAAWEPVSFGTVTPTLLSSFTVLRKKVK